MSTLPGDLARASGDPLEQSGRVALVTGASRGIGAAIARRLAADGAAVVLAARSLEPLRLLEKELGDGAMAVRTDLKDTADLDALIDRIRDRWGRLDILVNNAGVMPPARRLERTSKEDWDAVIAVNLTAPWYLSCRARELMAEGGAIVNVAGTAALYPAVGLSPYNITKAGLAMLTRSCALEWAKHRIRVNAVVPGLVDTEMARPVLDYLDSNDLPVNPLGRIGSVEEVAELVAFLTGPSAGYITGALIPIDGGELISVP